jgi:hypothetical protein
MTQGSAIKDTMRMGALQAPQVRGSASKIFLSKRAHVLGASLEESELSTSSGARGVHRTLFA